MTAAATDSKNSSAALVEAPYPGTKAMPRWDLGELIEVSPTKQMFENPTNKLTEDYITGHFG